MKFPGFDAISQSGRHRARSEVPQPGRPGDSDDGQEPTGGLESTPLAGDPPVVRRVNPFELPDPVGFTHATVARGEMVFLAGQTGTDIDGRIVDGGLCSQFDRALQNLLIALAAAGGEPQHLASLTVYVTDIAEYQAESRPISAVWRARVGTEYPAMALVEVRQLWDPEAVVELQGFGVLP